MTTKLKTSAATILLLALLTASCTSQNAIPTPEDTTTQSFPDLSDLADQTTSTPSTTVTVPEPTLEEAKAEIEAFMHDENEKWHACANQPQDCDIERQLGEIHIGGQLEASTKLVEGLLEEGLVARPPENPEHDQYVIEEIEIRSPTAQTATVHMCDIDGHTVYRPGGAPDGTDLVVAGQVISVKRKAELQKTELGWRMSSFPIDVTFTNGDGCDQ